MPIRLLPWMAFIAALGAAMIGGLLFAFSNFVMRALLQIPPAAGTEAMQRINVEIINPLFLSIFLGTPVVGVLTVIGSLYDTKAVGRGYLVSGAVCYVAGVLGVTALFNVPLNNTLVSVGSEVAPTHWPQYVTVWLRWNHIRTIFAVLSAIFWALGAYVGRRV